MPTPTTHMGLLKPSTTDPFVTGDIATNWQTLDNSPGILVCTSTTRPTWGANQAGMFISETDTGLFWRWTGTQFVRQQQTGWLGGSIYNTAISTTSTAVPAIGASVTVSVATGGGRVLVVANSPSVVTGTSSYGPFVGIQRDGVSIWNEEIAVAYQGDKGQYVGVMNLIVSDVPGAGSHTYRVTLLSNVGYSMTMNPNITIDVYGM